jgi:hypothetical protein
VRKEVAAARGLVAEALAEVTRLDRDEEKIVPLREMLRGGLARLRGGGEVDTAVARVDRSAAEDAGVLGIAPQSRGADFVDQSHGAAQYRSSWGSARPAVATGLHQS